MSEAARIAFENDARARYPGLRLTRKDDGYINPGWDADWRTWQRAWNAGVAGTSTRQREPAPDHVKCALLSIERYLKDNANNPFPNGAVRVLQNYLWPDVGVDVSGEGKE